MRARKVGDLLLMLLLGALLALLFGLYVGALSGVDVSAIIDAVTP